MAGTISGMTYAAVEAGGTKFVLGIGSAAAGSIARTTVPTRDPATTMADIARFFAAAGQGVDIAALGLASFGPVDLDPASSGYGHILASPKRAWSGFDLLGALHAALGGIPAGIDTDVNAAALAEAALGGIPAGIDTDVNAAAIAEAALGAGMGAANLAYITIGTGIGVGLLVDGRAVHGIAHPEAGHVRPRRHPAHGDFAGICPFHGDCLEGLASGPAIMACWGAELSALPPGHPAWAVQSDYVAQLCAMLILTLAPELIVLGGGAMPAALFALVRAEIARQLAGYGRQSDAAALERRIVAPGCAEPSGLTGAYLLAERAASGGGES